jgi:hypothetical protein
MTTPAERALLVDIGSIHSQLMIWRHRGEFAAADQVLDLFGQDPDRWLRALGQQRPDGMALTLRDFDQRTLIMPRTDVAAGTMSFFTHLRGLAAFDDGYRSAVDRFEQFGFRIVVSTASPSLQFSIELMRMLRERALPTEVVIATASPDVSGLLPTLRSLGVRTSVVAVMSRAETNSIYETVDAVLDLRDLTEALDEEIERGFVIRDPRHREQIHADISAILDDPRHRAGVADTPAEQDATFPYVTLDALRDELAGRSRYSASLPREDGGLRELLKEMLAENEYDPVLSSYRLTSDRLVPLRTLRGAAVKLREIVERAPRWPQGIRLADLANIMHRSFEDGRDQRWLGYETFSRFLQAVIAVEPDLRWRIDLTEPGYLAVPDEPPRSVRPTSPTHPATAPTTPEVDERDELLIEVAQFVDRRLRESSAALPLVELANDTPQAVEGVSPSNGWYGYRTFLALLRAAQEMLTDTDWVFETQVSPGYIRRRGHQRPTAVGATMPPFRTTATYAASVRTPAAQLRTVISDFPKDEIEVLLCKIAVTATVLATTPAAIVQQERLKIARFIQREANDRDIPGGRVGFGALVRSARLPIFDNRTVVALGEHRYVGAGYADRMLIGVGLELCFDPADPTRAPGGAARLHELMSDALTAYLSGITIGSDLLREDPGIVRRVLGPVTPPPERADELRLLPLPNGRELDLESSYRDFRTNYPGGAPEEPAHLLELMTRMQADRAHYLASPAPEAKPDEARERARRDLEGFVADELAADPGPLALDRLFERYREAGGGPIDDRITFLQALTETVELQEEADAPLAWRLDLEVAPGSVALSEGARLDPEQQMQRAWLKYSKAFALDALIRKGLPIGWPEAAWFMVRHHGLIE